MDHNPLPHSTGVRTFFPAHQPGRSGVGVRGIGIREVLPAGLVERPHGTEDYLIALFHDASMADCRPGGALRTESDFLMIWPPGAPQFYGNPSGRLTHSWIHCRGKRIQDVLRATRLPVRAPFPLPDPPAFQQSLLAVHEEMSGYGQPDFPIVGNLIENMLRHQARMRRQPPHAREGTLLLVKRFLSTAPAQRVTLAGLAAMAGMSVPHFAACFRRAFGLSPIECLIAHRMHHAAQLLANRTLSITEIAARAGYDDLFHFSKQFKKRFGASPRDLRRRLAERPGPRRAVPRKIP